MSGPLIYLAGPLFSLAEQEFNRLLTVRLEREGFRVFLPQRDGPELHRPPYDTLPPDAWREAIFTLDARMVAECDILLFVLDGRVPDEGACVELGMAYVHQTLHQPHKRLIGYHTDRRGAFPGGQLNPMLGVPLEAVVSTEEELLGLLGSP